MLEKNLHLAQNRLGINHVVEVPVAFNSTIFEHFFHQQNPCCDSYGTKKNLINPLTKLFEFNGA